MIMQIRQTLLPNNIIDNSIWDGLAAYYYYQFNDQWHTSIRGEVFDDREGYRTGVKQCWKELTMTLVYTPIKHLEFRLETRRDFSNVNSFFKSHQVGSTNYQQSYALEGLLYS